MCTSIGVAIFVSIYTIHVPCTECVQSSVLLLVVLVVFIQNVQNFVKALLWWWHFGQFRLQPTEFTSISLVFQNLLSLRSELTLYHLRRRNEVISFENRKLREHYCQIPAKCSAKYWERDARLSVACIVTISSAILVVRPNSHPNRPNCCAHRATSTPLCPGHGTGFRQFHFLRKKCVKCFVGIQTVNFCCCCFVFSVNSHLPSLDILLNDISIGILLVLVRVRCKKIKFLSNIGNNYFIFVSTATTLFETVQQIHLECAQIEILWLWGKKHENSNAWKTHNFQIYSHYISVKLKWSSVNKYARFQCIECEFWRHHRRILRLSVTKWFVGCAMLNRQMELTFVERIENHPIDVCTNPTFAKEKNQRITFRGHFNQKYSDDK